MTTTRLLLFVTLLAVGMLPREAAAQFFNPTCTVDTLSPTLEFGVIPANPTAQVDSSGSINLTCRGIRGAEILACVGLTNGEGNSLIPRHMANRTNASPVPLAYQIYRGPSRAGPLVWGNLNTNLVWSSVVSVPGGNGFFGNVNIPIVFYGRIESGQSDLSAGNYDSSMGGSRIIVAYNNGGDCSTIANRPNTSGVFQLTASASIASSCTIDANNLNFGVRNRLDTAAVDASTTLGVTCTVDTPYTVRLDGGTTTGDVAGRQMALNGSGAGVIDYELRHTSANGPLWGDGTGGTGVVNGTGTGGSQTLPVYGRVPVQATPAVGYYEDTVTVTVQY